MIIKSNTHRHWPGIIKRLIHYIDSDKGRSDAQNFAVNYNHFSQSLHETICAFEINDKHRKARSNGVCLRHHIMSFAPESTKYLTPEKLNNLAFKYLELRNEKGLVFAKPHMHENHVHLHFLISGNEVQSHKSTRRSKADFQRIHKELETYQLENYPELSDSIVKLKERTPTIELATIQEKVLGCFGQAKDQEQFVAELKKQKLEPYLYRDKLRGVLDEKGQKHRFGKFGVKPETMGRDKLERLKELKHFKSNQALNNISTPTISKNR